MRRKQVQGAIGLIAGKYAVLHIKIIITVCFVLIRIKTQMPCKPHQENQVIISQAAGGMIQQLYSMKYKIK